MQARDAKLGQVIETLLPSSTAEGGYCGTGRLYRVCGGVGDKLERASVPINKDRITCIGRFQPHSFCYVHKLVPVRVIEQFPKGHPLHVEGF